MVLMAQAASEAPKPPQVPIAIVISSRRDTGDTLSSELCAKVKDALAAQGIEAMSAPQSAERLAKLGAVDSHACDGSKLCLAKLAELLQGIVIGVDIGKVQKFSAGHLEAVAVGRVDSLAVSDFSSDAKGWPKKSAAETAAFVAEVVSGAREMNKALEPVKVAVVQPPPPPPPKVAVVEPPPPPTPKVIVADMPTEVKLIPEPPPTPPPVIIEEPRSRGPLPYVVVGTAVAAAVVAVTLLVLALIDTSKYNGTTDGFNSLTTSSLTRAQLDMVAAEANLKYSVSLGTGIGAAALGVVAGILLVREPQR